MDGPKSLACATTGVAAPASHDRCQLIFFELAVGGRHSIVWPAIRAALATVCSGYVEVPGDC